MIKPLNAKTAMTEFLDEIWHETIFEPKTPSLRIFLFAKGIKSRCSDAFLYTIAFEMKINNIITISIIIISITLSRALVLPSIEADDFLALEKRQICPCTTGRGGPPSPYCCPNINHPQDPHQVNALVGMEEHQHVVADIVVKPRLQIF